MTTLIFLGSLAGIFVAVIVGESDGDGVPGRHRPTGLLTWIARGNWPAKIGGLLVVVGVGALLRYALLNIEVPAVVKLSAGVVLALAFGFLSTIVPDGPARRPVSLALAGAAFGVAYLTVYSAFGLFGYLKNPMGLGLLGLTSVATAAYAVHRSALSLAVLAMVGAFIAPAFAITDPGPQVVYGYYAGAGLLTLAMVTLRGWRPLIHLSFLFTLVGGVFFAWTARYFAPPHTEVMRIFVPMLAALHVAMPILERRSSHQDWLESLDFLYLISLPVVAVVLAYFLAFDRITMSTEVFVLAGIWTMAAVALAIARREGIAAHAAIAGLLAALAVAVRFRDLPWELLLLALSVAALGAAAWRQRPADRLHGTLAGSVVLFGALHMLDAVATSATGPAFANGAFAERIVGAALLIGAGAICRRIRQSLDTLLLAMGILWALLAVGVELVRIELATVSLVVHAALILLAGSLWIPGRKLLVADRNVAVLAVAIVLTAAWAAAGRPGELTAWIACVAASVAIIGLAIRPVMIEADSSTQRGLAALLAPAAAVTWALAATAEIEPRLTEPGLVAASLASIAVLLASRALPGPRGDWNERVVEIFGVGFALVLASATLLDIGRNSWAIALELLCLAGLVTVTWIRASRQEKAEVSTVACVLGLALILQSNLLRWLGPPGRLDVTDVLAVSWPAVISLLWVAVASLLTVWARKTVSRRLWVAGAALLVVSAVKLLVYDFGSLGELANILAVIAAGGIFLLVGWLAPMPPASEPKPEPEPSPSPPAIDSRAKLRVGNAPSVQPARPPGAPPSQREVVADRIRATADDEPETASSTRTVVILLAIAAMVFHFRDMTASLMRKILQDGPDGRSAEIRAPDQPVTQPIAVAPEMPGRDDGVVVPPGSGLPDAGSSTQADVGNAVSEMAPAAKSQAREGYSPPPTIGADGVPTYTQYSYPQTTASAGSGEGRKQPTEPSPGDAGIEELLADGSLRRAERADLARYLIATRSNPRDVERNRSDFESGQRYLRRTYVVLREMTYPAGLYGAHSATFIVPADIPRPYGDPGHSNVLEMPN